MVALNRRSFFTAGVGLVGVSFLSTSAAHATSYAGFDDVTDTHPFFKEISWMSQRGISRGWLIPSVGMEFRPYLPVARDAMAAFIFRWSGAELIYTPRPNPSFKDIPTNYQFYKEIDYIAVEGITTGYSDGTYRPHNLVERGAMAAFLYRLARLRTSYQPPAKSPFRDVPPTHQFYKEICWMYENGITTGYPDGSFRPSEPVRRDACAAFLYRFDQKKFYSAQR